MRTPARSAARHRRSSPAVRRLALVGALVVLVAGCDWTATGFGPGNTNFDPSEPALTASSVRNLGVAWSAPCACSRALVANGRVFTVDGLTGSQPYTLTVRAFDATTGQLKWSTPLGTSQVGEQLSAVSNGLVYVLVRPETGSDRVVALEEATGAVRWLLTPPAQGSDPVRIFAPIVVDGPLGFVATGGFVFAVDSTGHIVWFAAPGGGVSALTADSANHILYTASTLGTNQLLQLVTGYAEADGHVSSSVVAKVPGFVPLGPLSFSDGLIFGTQGNTHAEGGVGAFALHPDTGSLAWSGDLQLTAVTPSAAVDFTLRVHPNTTVRNPSTGAVLWQADTGSGAQAVAGDLVYDVGFTGGAFEIRRLSTGSVVATVPLPAGDSVRSLTPSGGRVYAVANTHIYALAPA